MKPYAYISGALTAMDEDERRNLRRHYEFIAGIAEEVGFDSYCPHKHSDPTQSADLKPSDVDRMDRTAVTSAAIVIAEVGKPSFGTGIEIEMAFHAHVPVILVHPAQIRVSRLVLGSPAVYDRLAYEDRSDLRTKLPEVLRRYIDSAQVGFVLPKPLQLRLFP